MDKNKIYIPLFIIGIIGAVISDVLALIYGFIGIIILMIIQLSLLSKSGKFALIGGKPTLEIEGNRKVYAIIGLSMLTSAFIGFLCKLVFLKYAI